jgi:Transposase DDE domain.
VPAGGLSMGHGFPTAPLASGLRGAGGGAVENPAPQVFTRSQSTYRPRNSVQTSGATSVEVMTVCQLYKSRWQVELFFRWIKQHLRIKRFFGTSERRQDAGVDRRRHLRSGGDRQKAPRLEDVLAFDATDLERDAVRKNPVASILAEEPDMPKTADSDTQLSLL